MALAMPTLLPLAQAIEGLDGRVQDAADFSEMMKNNRLPQVCPAGFVLPMGLRGGSVDAVTGMYRQNVAWHEGVVLVVRSSDDATGAKSKKQLRPLIIATIGAVAGAPATADGDDFGVWRLVKGELLSLAGGGLIYQLDFAIDDQVRIPR